MTDWIVCQRCGAEVGVIDERLYAVWECPSCGGDSYPVHDDDPEDYGFHWEDDDEEKESWEY